MDKNQEIKQDSKIEQTKNEIKQIQITGAGVFLIEQLTNLDGSVEYSVILMSDGKRSNNRYDDFGGKVEPDIQESVEQTAARELLEESGGLFMIDDQYLNEKNSILIGQTYRAFIIKIQVDSSEGEIKFPKISLDLFLHNLDLLEKNKDTPDCWKEACILKRILISTLLKTNILESKQQTLDIFKDEDQKTDIVLNNRAWLNVRALMHKITKKHIDLKDMPLVQVKLGQYDQKNLQAFQMKCSFLKGCFFYASIN